MDLFRMKGAWGPLLTALYNRVVAPALTDLYRERLPEMLAADRDTAGRLLDVGCGRGDALAIVTGLLPGVRAVGLDLSPGMLVEARRRHAGNARLALCRADALALPFADGAFDFALSLASLKHWPDPARGLAELRRVLRPGGRLALMEADADATPAAIRAFVGRWRWTPPLGDRLAIAYFGRFVARQSLGAPAIAALLAAAGFVDLDVAARADLPAVVARGRRAG